MSKEYIAKEGGYFIAGLPVERVMDVLQIGETTVALYRGVAVSEGHPMIPSGEAYITSEICPDSDFEVVETD